MTKTKIIEVAEWERKLLSFYTTEIADIEARDKSSFPLQEHEKYKQISRAEYTYLLKLASEALNLRIQLIVALAKPAVGCGNPDCPDCGGDKGDIKCH